MVDANVNVNVDLWGFEVVFYRVFAGRWEAKDSGYGKQNTADMTQFVQTLLQQMQNRFQTMSDSIVSKIDEMGERISELEQSINDLRAEMGAEGPPPPAAPPKDEE
ncbi:heat shock factor-binding protein-like [Bidens hawaiensis]|uniref:heat shock factor-binding protein-like n=1 Tax=Bidens hawaiensis TaxID=980011 RepID=UPI00404B3B2B